MLDKARGHDAQGRRPAVEDGATWRDVAPTCGLVTMFVAGAMLSPSISSAHDIALPHTHVGAWESSTLLWWTGAILLTAAAFVNRVLLRRKH